MNRPAKAMAVLVLIFASLFDICGCKSALNCDPLHAAKTSTTPWETLVQQCGRCFSPQKLATRDIQESPIPHDESAILHDMTIEDDARAAQHGVGSNIYGGLHEVLTVPDGRSVVWSSTASLQQARPIAWPIPESVLFLYADPPIGPSAEAQDAMPRIATGFILSVAERRGETSRYLVTARHVVDPEWAHCGKRNPRNITVRLNRRSGGVSYETISLDANHERQFIAAADQVTDLALIPINAATVSNFDRYKLVETGFENLPTDGELSELRKEQRIVTVGVSAPKLTGLIDSPISESGLITTDVTGSPMAVRCTVGSPLQAFQMWLIDASVERGVSGSPVYAAITRGPNHLTTPVLVGIQAVVWPDKGQAGITPVSALRDLVQLRMGSKQVALNFRGRPD